jgi:hypothetical protein
MEHAKRERETPSSGHEPRNSIELSRRFALRFGAFSGDIIMFNDPYSACCGPC